METLTREEVVESLKKDSTNLDLLVRYMDMVGQDKEYLEQLIEEARIFRDAGIRGEAEEAYLTAIDNALIKGNGELAAELQEELSKL